MKEVENFVAGTTIATQATRNFCILAPFCRRDGDMTPRAVIIHSLEQARAALAAAERLDRPILLYSAEGAAAYAGAAWFLAIIAAAQTAHTRARCEAVLDCGADAGLALAALREGCRAVVIRGAPRLRRKLSAIAAMSAARLDAGAKDALDLRHSKNPEAAVMAWLSDSEAAT